MNFIHSAYCLPILIACTFVSCDLIFPEPQNPAYIQIDSFRLLDNTNAVEGSLKHDIVDAWVFIDDEMIGIYELPAKIPVLESGTHKLTVGPGILVSTTSSIRENYPFYTAYTDRSLNLIDGEIIEVIPTCTYRDPGNQYEYIVVDDFESAFIQTDTFSGSMASLVKTTDKGYVFEGNGSGLVEIEATDSIVALRTPAYQFPQGSKPVYMEINYYSDYSVTIGMFVKNIGIQNEIIDYLTLKPTTDEDDEEHWKKAYIELTSITSGAANPESFYAFFNIRVENAAQRLDGHFAIDNIKFLYQK